MRKLRLFFAAATLCAAAAVGYNAYETATMTEQERLVQANLEALSQGGESGGYDNWIEYGTNCSGCGKSVQSCLWAYDGIGSSCTPSTCSYCGNEGSYIIL